MKITRSSEQATDKERVKKTSVRIMTRIMGKNPRRRRMREEPNNQKQEKGKRMTKDRTQRPGSLRGKKRKHQENTN